MVLNSWGWFILACGDVWLSQQHIPKRSSVAVGKWMLGITMLRTFFFRRVLFGSDPKGIGKVRYLYIDINMNWSLNDMNVIVYQ
jgi:hypothetical protein